MDGGPHIFPMDVMYSHRVPCALRLVGPVGVFALLLLRTAECIQGQLRTYSVHPHLTLLTSICFSKASIGNPTTRFDCLNTSTSPSTLPRDGIKKLDLGSEANSEHLSKTPLCLEVT